MFTTIKGTFDHGQIILNEAPPVDSKTEVIITFLVEEPLTSGKQKRIPGSLKGKVAIPDDFNEPLNDFKDYM